MVVDRDKGVGTVAKRADYVSSQLRTKSFYSRYVVKTFVTVLTLALYDEIKHRI